jgi:hypothetical protein
LRSETKNPQGPDGHGGEGLLRLGVMIVFLVGAIGSGVELLLLGHFEDWQQWIPLVLLLGGIPPAVWTLISRDRRSVLIVRGLGMAYVISGLVGVALHFHGNREFELEMVPSLHGFELIGQALSGATPALAPGVMVQLGLMALLYTFRHPVLNRAVPPVARSSAPGS